ncbi:MAG: hypothetical protein JST47_07875 [Bacteroidetes bacterium]|nr:hypothetical protein [Bacteroidota bacterium]MBS1972884.1 hypothetical protein [Bacteroidota bacterium]
MKNAVVQLCFVLLAITSLHAMKQIKSNTIVGKVSAPGALEYAWAIHDKDSVIVAASNGTFNLKVKPGVWKVLLHTKTPYKNEVIHNVVVSEGHSTNLGEIILEQ